MGPSRRLSAERHALLVFVLVVVLVGAGACERGAERNPETEVRACESAGMAVDFASLGINTLANLSDAAVVGTFESVAVPRRDERIGGVYGDARFRVERAVFESPTLRAKPGDVLVLRLMARDECGVGSYEAFSGPVGEGERSFLLVDHIAETGENNVNYLRNWRVVRGADGVEYARSTDSRRDAPLDQVIRRVTQERAAGRDANRDTGTENRPFG